MKATWIRDPNNPTDSDLPYEVLVHLKGETKTLCRTLDEGSARVICSTVNSMFQTGGPLVSETLQTLASLFQDQVHAPYEIVGHEPVTS